jgi:hypothetical protein
MVSALEAMRAQLASAVIEHPFAATATAAGVGFVLGGGMTRAALALLIQTGTRIAATWLSEAIRHQDESVAAEEGPT